MISTMALTLALATGGAVALAPPAFAKKKEEQAKGPNISKEARPAIAAAQTAIAAGDFATATAQLATAQAAAKTADDSYYIANLKLQIAQKQGDTAATSAAVEAIIASGAAPPDQLKSLYDAQGRLAYQAKDYAKAQTAFAKVAELGTADPEVYLLLADMANRNKQPQQAITYADQAIAAQKATGQPVTEEWYKRRLSIAYDGKLAPQAIQYATEVVQNYPSPENWRNALLIYRDSAKLDSQTDLDLYRLMRATKSLTGERDYYDYASSANDRGLPGEALAVLDLGAQTNNLSAAKAGPLRSEITGRVAEDKKSLPASATKAKSAADGKMAMNTADAYLGYGEYAKAAELYQVALTKGGVDANMLNTRLGIALALQGQKDAAKTALASVTGPRQQVANFWTIWLNQPAA
jgi:hypothetical protein